MIKYYSQLGNVINEDDDIKNALQLLDKEMIKTLFVVDEQNHLVATLTDGDIRRAIVSGKTLDTPIKDVAHYNPIFLSEIDKDRADRELHKNKIMAIPCVDHDRKIVGAFYSDAMIRNSEEKVDLPVVIMAGGQGTRLYPYTKILPKPLIPVEGIPISERIMDALERNGCKDFFMIVNYKKEMIKSYFFEEKRDICFVDEKSALGTAGGIKLLERDLKKVFILTNCDILILENISNIVHFHEESRNDVTVVSCLKNFEVPYGVIEIDDGGNISSFKEKPEFSFFTNTGFYIIDPVIYQYIKYGEKVGMPEVLERMRNDGKKVGIYPIGEEAWLDMGQFDTMESMERKIREIDL